MRSTWYLQLAAHFDDKGLERLAVLCRGLAARHDTLAGALDSPDPWPDGETNDFVLALAGPRRILEIARLAEEADRREAERIRGSAADPALIALIDRAIGQALDNADALAHAMDAVPEPLEWEGLIAGGTVPSLALGAERRERR